MQKLAVLCDSVGRHLLFLIVSYIDDPFSGVFDVDADGEIEEVVDRVPSGAELVHGFFPGESALVPGISIQDWPTAQAP